MMYRILSALIILPLLMSTPSHAGDITVLTNHVPPLKMMQDGMPTGVVGDMLVWLMDRVGKPIEPGDTKVAFLERGVEETMATPRAVFLALTRLPERENDFKWVGPVYRTTLAIIAKAASHIRLRGPSDITPYSVVTVRKSSCEATFLARGFAAGNLHRCSSSNRAVKHLVEGDTDLLVLPKTPAFHTLIHMGIDPKAYEVVYEMNSYDLYLAFNKDTDDALIAKLQSALQEMKRPGKDGVSVYDSIVQKYFRPIL